MTPITFAHRGARADHPENTIRAFRHALDRGARGLETDAWLSADGQVVLVHDAMIRVWRSGIPRRLHVERTTAADLAEHDVPRLTDLRAELGTDYELSIDLKSPDVGKAILDATPEPDDRTRLWLCSPSRRRLRALREQTAETRLVHSQWRQRLPESLERHAADLAAARIDAMNLHHSEWTAGLVALFHRFSIRAFAWDVQEVRHLRAMLTMSVDGVFCDHVDRMVATVAEFEGEA
jgi:glycerophosphoryl diester phosphodiesterase